MLVAHRFVSMLRQSTKFARLVDPPPRVLVVDGHVVHRELVRTGLTRTDLFGLLRQHGVVALDDLRLAVFEQRGQLTVVRRDAVATEGDLLSDLGV